MFSTENHFVDIIITKRTTRYVLILLVANRSKGRVLLRTQASVIIHIIFSANLNTRYLLADERDAVANAWRSTGR